MKCVNELGRFQLSEQPLCKRPSHLNWQSSLWPGRRQNYGKLQKHESSVRVRETVVLQPSVGTWAPGFWSSPVLPPRPQPEHADHTTQPRPRPYSLIVLRAREGTSNILVDGIRTHELWDFPGCPVVKTAFQCRGWGFNPWSRSWDPMCLMAKTLKHKAESVL